MPKIPSRPALDLSGKGSVDLPSLSADYLAQSPDQHVLIRHEEFYRFTAIRTSRWSSAGVGNMPGE